MPDNTSLTRGQLRGFMIDSARCLENREYYRKLIRFTADRGMNTLIWHFSDDQGLSLEFPSASELADANAYTAQEIGELVSYAKDHGVTLVPELETLGHSRYITRHERYRHLRECDEDFTAICPVHPLTRKLMRSLLKDVADLFPSPWIHVGMDEVKLGEHPLTKEALKTQSRTEIFADYIRFIYEEVSRLDRKMMMWVDRNSYETGVMEMLPRDILLALWQYSPDVTPELAQCLLADGFDVILCPALITYDQQAFPGSIALPNIEHMSSFQKLSGKGQVRGIVTTIWTPMRYMHDCLWPGISWAADAMLAAGKPDLARSMEHYLCDFHDVLPGEKLVNALVECFHIAPERKEYLTLLKAEAVAGDEACLKTLEEKWSMIAVCFKEALPAISREVTAFEALLSFAGFMTYLYRRARLCLSRSWDPTQFQEVLAQGKRWLDTLETIWDYERFSNDSRKVVPMYAWEENEYMIICFRKSMQRLEAEYRTQTQAIESF